MKLNPLTAAEFTTLKPFFRQQSYRISTYTLSSIIVWSNELARPHYTIDGGTLLVSAEFTKEPEKGHLLLPLCPERVFTPEELSALARKWGYRRYFFVPEDYLHTFGRDRVTALFDIKECAAYDDYLYLQKDLQDLAGNRYSKKRNLIRQFTRNYKDRVQVEPITSRVGAECMDFLEEWCVERNCDKNADEELYCEKVAAGNALENYDALEFDGILVRVDGKVSAFGIGSKLTADTGALHFEKAFAGIKGLYQYFDRLCAKMLFSGYRYINKESDMGVEGLIRAKKSYYPVEMVRSFELLLK